jgi:hypothetical protein
MNGCIVNLLFSKCFKSQLFYWASIIHISVPLQCSLMGSHIENILSYSLIKLLGSRSPSFANMHDRLSIDPMGRRGQSPQKLSDTIWGQDDDNLLKIKKGS